MVIIFLVLSVTYFYRLWHLQPPSIGESQALFWTGLIFVIMYVILGIYCLWHLFSHTEKVVDDDHHHHHAAPGYQPGIVVNPAPYPLEDPTPSCAQPSYPMFTQEPHHYQSQLGVGQIPYQPAHDLDQDSYLPPLAPYSRSYSNTYRGQSIDNDARPTISMLSSPPPPTIATTIAAAASNSEPISAEARYNYPETPTTTGYVPKVSTSPPVLVPASSSSTTSVSTPPVTVTSQPPKLVPLLA